ncbi:RNA polymerase-binding protein DksA [Rhodoferax sp.]|uniref:RNA polymerase-binding protein DksA n=1 Tax=Rhodoferax sp. TaxID=50421 RepID=UPI0026306645|nr:RNA polymerase-binding protein DksA [Rhodoferax sp.]MDD3937448.1 RNA polymerase-binding protein DksA [Rhodoferax sp.]
MKAQTVKSKATAKKAAAVVEAVKPVAVKQPAAKVAKPVVSVPKKKPQEVTTQTPVSPKAAAPATQMTPSGVPVRTGRPSSRLAQLTVPSMAQTVASTAAKASFTQMTSVAPIVSPLASSVKKDKKLANNWKTKPVNELTDAEILAMSDDDYMNDTQLAYFRLKLVNLKNDMLNNAGETTEHLREDTVVVPDPADRATIEEEHALELRTRDRERKLLKKIEQSITRIDAGDYGYCDETGEAIGVGRLLARPTATLSLEAQQRRELKQKMFGD